MSDYKQDPNDIKKQIPGDRPDNFWDRSSTPPQNELVKTPNAVIIGNLNGDVGFFFGGSGSFSEIDTTDAATLSISSSGNYTNFGAVSSGTTLNIHPNAWSGSSGDVVTFVYSSGLSTGPR